MPSFADSHGDDDLRAAVAFVQTLPGIREEQYAAYEKAQ